MIWLLVVGAVYALANGGAEDMAGVVGGAVKATGDVFQGGIDFLAALGKQF